MAKKKNKPLIRPWCWYCEREFEDEKVLMQHQKAKHFKCGLCPRRLNTAGGLAVHIQQVHKLDADNLPRIDNALPGRDGYEIEIFGMEGIPAPDVADYKRRKEIELGLSAGSISQPPPKRAKTENRALTEDELRAQLEAHKALMGQGAGVDVNRGESTTSTSVYGAPAQAYSVPPTPTPGPGGPVPTPPGGYGAPPMGFPGQMPPMMPGSAPPFPPPFAMGMPPGLPPPTLPPSRNDAALPARPPWRPPPALPPWPWVPAWHGWSSAWDVADGCSSAWYVADGSSWDVAADGDVGYAPAGDGDGWGDGWVAAKAAAGTDAAVRACTVAAVAESVAGSVAVRVPGREWRKRRS
ncbi:hypothetical protein DFP72DRAFT_206428 [Ephemerocybe angulata]|uniref:C2H2-type domain-containing protein n=1 Tax=Ephemerocybe angulata TaxID=980116 RepID=A0A8H6IHF3_9AGAR|nr:hypothetical protein DFP72DRAFT_206428 [Tulosesus angulatus]